jgi:hypothetical protein
MRDATARIMAVVGRIKAAQAARLGRPAPPSQPPECAPASGLPDPEAARVLALPLDRLDQMVEVRVPWHDTPLWFVPSETDAEVLTAEGVSRGVIWTARELADLIALGLTRDQVQTLAHAKRAVGGDVVLWRTRPTPTQEDRG